MHIALSKMRLNCSQSILLQVQDWQGICKSSGSKYASGFFKLSSLIGGGVQGTQRVGLEAERGHGVELGQFACDKAD